MAPSNKNNLETEWANGASVCSDMLDEEKWVKVSRCLGESSVCQEKAT